MSIDALELGRFIVELIADQKGENVVLLDIQGISILADYFVIASTTSERQAKALIEEIRTEIKQAHGLAPLHVEGDPADGWVLLDYADVVVHLFLQDTREYYDLEGLWKEARVIVRML